MEWKRTILPLLVVVSLLVSWLAVKAASQAALTLNIEPRVYLEAPPSVVWGNAGDGDSLQLPLTLKIRLNRGTYADLSISRTDSIPVTGSNPDSGGPLQLEVVGSDGITDLSGTPVVLGRFSQSGVYQRSVTLRLPVAPGSGSYLIPLRLQLSSSDGLAAPPVAVTVRLERP